MATSHSFQVQVYLRPAARRRRFPGYAWSVYWLKVGGGGLTAET